MKNRKIISLALLLASLAAGKAQTTLVDWTFDNDGISAPVLSPAPASGIDLSTATATTVGLTTSLTPTPSIAAPDIILNPAVDSDSTPTLDDAWRIRATGSSPNTGNGWTDASGIGTQGAKFSVSTVGYNNIQLTFDISATKAGEGLFQVEYTTDGVIWSNAVLTYAPNPNLVLSNSTPGTGTNGLVIGSYFSMVETGTYAQVWYTNVTANLSGIPAANNNPNFAVEIVNAGMGTNCPSASGTALNNTSGNWSIDNVALSGTPPASAITAWDFDTYAAGIVTNSPVPSFGFGTAIPLGMTNDYDDGTGDSVATCDILATAGASTGAGSSAWRVRGGGGTFSTAGAPNGWSSEAAIASQGAEFDVNTAGYAYIQLSFDLYLTTQAPAQMTVEYTTDGVNWTNAPTLDYAANPAYILTNPPVIDGGSPNTVTGTYFYETGGQGFYTNITATFPATANDDANFGVRIVNATTGADDLNALGAPYNNSSGNWRYDNIVISGVVSGSGAAQTPPVLNAATGVSVTSVSFTNTFTDSSAWRAAITNLSVNGTTLAPSAYAISAGQIVYTLAATTLFQTSGTKNISVAASGYNKDIVAQVIVPGPATQVILSAQPVAPAGDGGTLVAQPTLVFQDVYGNVATSEVATVTATVGSSGTWSLGGAAVQTANAGTVNFTNLSASSTAAYANATITFNAPGSGVSPSTITSSSFNIPAPATAFTPGNIAVLQEDVASANSTFSIIELSPSIANQSAPVNVFPVPATGTNALRESSAATTGRLAVSEDGTLVAFAAFEDGTSLTADETTITNRGVGTFNAAGSYVLQTSYQGISGNQARSATSLDDTNWFIGDKGGVYMNNETAQNPYVGGTANNVRSLKSFGGNVYALQQYSSSLAKTVLQVVQPGGILYPLDGFPEDANVLDFYLVKSGQNGTNYDTCYYIDGTNATSGSIFKFCVSTNPADVDQDGVEAWVAYGSAVTANGGDGLYAATNVTGGVDLYYTTGSGGQAGNSLIKVSDSGIYNQPISLNAPQTLYTVNAQATLKGVAPAPTVPGGASQPITPFGITPGSAHFTGSVAAGTAQFSFSFNNTAGLSSSFSILATTNLTPPIQWQNLGHPTEVTPGVYQFVNPSATNQDMFYTVHQP